jgi:hypothetical protein
MNKNSTWWKLARLGAAAVFIFMLVMLGRKERSFTSYDLKGKPLNGTIVCSYMNYNNTYHALFNEDKKRLIRGEYMLIFRPDADNQTALKDYIILQNKIRPNSFRRTYQLVDECCFVIDNKGKVIIPKGVYDDIRFADSKLGYFIVSKRGSPTKILDENLQEHISSLKGL